MAHGSNQRSVPDGSVKKPARPQKEPFLGVQKCIPSPLGSRIAPPGAMFSRASFMIRGPVGFFTDPDARGSACAYWPLTFMTKYVNCLLPVRVSWCAVLAG